MGHEDMNVFERKPEPFFTLVVHNVEQKPGFTGACSGFECGTWRHKALADYLFEWLPEFALKYSELEDLNSASAMRLIKKAATTVYTTDKYQKRGEFGELLLHAVLREVFDSQPAISKIFFKTSTNDTVKGFDAVHVVESDGILELWLGEVKFYKNVNSAIAEVVKELEVHTDGDWLRKEFIAIDSKVDSRWSHAKAFQDLISRRTSLDVLFKRICIPVLLTYESDCVKKFSAICDEYTSELTAELEGIFKQFSSKPLPNVRIHLFLVPIHEKKSLIEVLHKKLEGLQR